MTDEEHTRSLSLLVDQLTIMLEAERDYETFEVLHDMRETALRIAAKQYAAVPTHSPRKDAA